MHRHLRGRPRPQPAIVSALDSLESIHTLLFEKGSLVSACSRRFVLSLHCTPNPSLSQSISWRACYRKEENSLAARPMKQCCSAVFVSSRRRFPWSFQILLWKRVLTDFLSHPLREACLVPLSAMRFAISSLSMTCLQPLSVLQG